MEYNENYWKLIKKCDKEFCLKPYCYNFIGFLNNIKNDTKKIKELVEYLISKKFNIINLEETKLKNLKIEIFIKFYENRIEKENLLFMFYENKQINFNKIEEYNNLISNENFNDIISFSKLINEYFKLDKEYLNFYINLEKDNYFNLIYNDNIFKKNLEKVILLIISLSFIYEPYIYLNIFNLKNFIWESIFYLKLNSNENFDFLDNIEENYFVNWINKIQNLITFFNLIPDSNEYDMLLLLYILKIFNNLRIKKKIGNKNIFINESINKNIDLKLLVFSYHKNKRAKITNLKHYLDFPFIFNTENKIDLISFESQLEMNNQINNQIFNLNNNLYYNLFNNFYFEIEVNRNNILADTLNELNKKAKGNQMKKKLKVKFIGEPGVDEGGLRKEFFQILIEKLFDPDFGMFVTKNDGRFIWFNSLSFECSLNFELVGIILGMAIYNSIVLDLNFPVVLYKKLMNEKLEIEDLIDIDPELYTTMKNIINYEGNAEDMNLYFSIDIDYFGYIETVNFIKNGENIKLNNENKSEYIEKYLDWYFNESIKKQYIPFEKGFYKVISSELFTMFDSLDIIKAICGSTDLNFEEWRKTTNYEDGYDNNHRIIQEFWEIILSYNEINKKKFLKFLTGSDRAPIKGLSEIKMKISRVSPDSENLPSCHTCFNHLLIPEYSNKKKLESKLNQAIENYEGFGLY